MPVARYLIVLTLLMLSCDVSTLVAPAGSAASPVPGIVDTIVAQTAAAAWTQTAAHITVVPTSTASVTPVPSDTPTITPSATPTFIFVLASQTPTRKPTSTLSAITGGLGCQLQNQAPTDGTHFSPKENFKAVWTVANTGQDTWDSTSMDFEYLSGAKLFTGASIYDLSKDVPTGASIKFSVPMVAPNKPGTYTTAWTLRQGKNDFCHVDLSIIVP